MLHLLKTFYHNSKGSIISFFKCAKALKESSYYPELQHKSLIRQYFDNALWALKYHEVNHFYFLYGLDVKTGNKMKDYKDYYSFMNERNAEIKSVYEQTILRNKYLFYLYLSAKGIETPLVHEFVTINTLHDFEIIASKYKNVFLKSIDGECASGVYKLNEKLTFSNIKKGNYIVQDEIKQSEEMKILNSNSINTIRIITFNNKGVIRIFAVGVRIGTSKSRYVDNWAAGGIFVPADVETGKLSRYGFYKPIYGGKTDKVVNNLKEIYFNNFTIPQFSDVKEIVKKAHELFPNVKSIGWDVAISESGPTIIEGNDNYEISLMQSGINNGMRTKWETLNNGD